MMKHRLFISPPFGNYIHLPFATSVKGSYTWDPRPGLLKQIVRTLRPISGGYVNRIGLRNEGIHGVVFHPHHIYSIVGMNCEDWDNFIEYMPSNLSLEINIGCPNGWQNAMHDEHIRRIVSRFPQVHFKLPPTITVTDIDRLIGLGIRKVHLCNTLPTDRGGESGSRLKQVVLPLITETKSTFPHLNIIAGGGIYRRQDGIDYLNAGATGLSLSTVWFNPVRGLYLARQLATLLSSDSNSSYQQDTIHEKFI